MMKHVCIAVLAGTLLLAGCESMSKDKDSTSQVTLLEDEQKGTTPAGTPPPAGMPAAEGLSLSHNQRFPDIPLPENLTPDQQRTFVYESDNLTIGRMVYTTKADVNEVAQFFINQCPLAGWRRENIIEADGVDLLFRKPDRRLDISVRAVSRSGTRLAISVTPDTGSATPLVPPAGTP